MSDLTARALSAAERRLNELMPMLERWVKTNSYSANVEGVNRMGELMAGDLDFPELELERLPGDGVGDHLVWRTPAWTSGSNRLMLIGHHDTVFPPGGFESWELEGDRLRGPGVLDMKGGLATVRTAVSSLHDIGVLKDLPLAIVSVGDEEIGSVHSKSMVQEIARGASAALVFEAGRVMDRIITQRKGTGGLNVTVTGKAAHAGNHHADGVNAIAAVAKLVLEAQSMTDYERGVTVNVGLIGGGEARNTVPGRATCAIDFRFESAEEGLGVESRLRAAAAAIAESTQTSFELQGGVRRLPLERSDASVALYREYGACAELSGLGREEAGLLGGGSDANTVSAVGVPAIDGLGPRGKGFHTHDEYIEVSSLAMRVHALTRFLVGRLE